MSLSSCAQRRRSHPDGMATPPSTSSVGTPVPPDCRRDPTFTTDTAHNVDTQPGAGESLPHRPYVGRGDALNDIVARKGVGFRYSARARPALFRGTYSESDLLVSRRRRASSRSIPL